MSASSAALRYGQYDDADGAYVEWDGENFGVVKFVVRRGGVESWASTRTERNPPDLRTLYELCCGAQRL